MSKISPGWKIVWVLLLCSLSVIILNGDDWYRNYYPFVPARIDKLEVVNEGPIYPGDLLTYHIVGEKFKTPLGGEFGAPIISVQVVDGYHWPAIVGPATETRTAGPIDAEYKTPALDPRAVPGSKHRFRWVAQYSEGQKAVVLKWSDYFTVSARPTCPPGEKGDTGQTGKTGKTGQRGKDFWGK